MRTIHPSFVISQAREGTIAWEDRVIHTNCESVDRIIRSTQSDQGKWNLPLRFNNQANPHHTLAQENLSQSRL